MIMGAAADEWGGNLIRKHASCCMSGKRRTFGEFRDFWGADRSGEKDLACGMLIHSNAMNRREVDAWSKEYSFCY